METILVAITGGSDMRCLKCVVSYVEAWYYIGFKIEDYLMICEINNIQ